MGKLTWDNCITLLSGAPSASIEQLAIYIIDYGYIPNGTVVNRMGLIRVAGESIEFIVKPYAFDTWVTLAMNGNNLVATFPDGTTVNRVRLKKLIF